MVEKNGRRYCNLSLYLVGDVKPDWENVGDVPPDCKEIGPVGNVTLPRWNTWCSRWNSIFRKTTISCLSGASEVVSWLQNCPIWCSFLLTISFLKWGMSLAEKKSLSKQWMVGVNFLSNLWERELGTNYIVVSNIQRTYLHTLGEQKYFFLRSSLTSIY